MGAQYNHILGIKVYFNITIFITIFISIVITQHTKFLAVQYNDCHILGLKPTGWTHSRAEGQESSLAYSRIVTKGQLSLLEVPYSEHSSYSELRRLINFLRIEEVGQIVPTVNTTKCIALEGM